MKQKNNIWLGFGAVLLAVAFLFIYQYPWDLGETEIVANDFTPNLLVESQAPGKFITIKQAVVPAGGFLVAHQDSGGKPGSVLGYSSYLKPGVNTSMIIVFDQPTIVGQSLLITLYADNGDYQLTGDDKPLVDSVGQTITSQLVIVNEDLLSPRQ